MMVIEESETLFDTSLFEPLIASISHATDTRYQESVNIIQSYRIVIDHIRSVVCLLADGVFPSNDMR
jgi:alanyl-tRNA synthetase